MKVGVIGICGFGQHHARAFAEIGCQVAAVADISDEVEQWAEQYSAKAFRDYEQLLAEDLDAVSIALPPSLHPDAIRSALSRDLPVFCEKPVASSVAEAERLLADLGADARVAVGFCLRYNPVYRRLKELIQSGQLGRIRTITVRKCWGTRTPWRLKQGGGAVFVKDIHYYDLIPWLLGEKPAELYARGGSFFYDGEAEDSYHLLMSFADGCIFHLDSAWWTLSHGVGSFEVVGDKARAVVDGETLRIINGEVKEEKPEGEAMVTAEIRHFVDWLQGNSSRPPGLIEAVEANRLAGQVVQQLHRSDS